LAGVEDDTMTSTLTLGWRFSADRMVMDYVLKGYIPAAGGTRSDVSRG